MSKKSELCLRRSSSEIQNSLESEEMLQLYQFVIIWQFLLCEIHSLVNTQKKHKYLFNNVVISNEPDYFDKG